MLSHEPQWRTAERAIAMPEGPKSRSARAETRRAIPSRIKNRKALTLLDAKAEAKDRLQLPRKVEVRGERTGVGISAPSIHQARGGPARATTKKVQQRIDQVDATDEAQHQDS